MSVEPDDYDEFGMLGDNAGEEDVTEFRRRLPAARVEVVPRAGHAIQSDQPLALARLTENFILQHP